MSEETHTSTNLDDGISMQELLITVKVYGFEVLKYSWLMIIIGCLLGWYMRERKLKSPTMYTAYCSFKMNDEASLAQEGISQLFGSSGGRGGAMSLKDLGEMSKTRHIVHKTLFHKVTLRHAEEEKDDFLINHFLRYFLYQSSAKSDQFYFDNDIINPYNRKENILIKSICRDIANNYFNLDVTPTKTANMKVISKNEDFSYELANALFRELDSFYVQKRLKQKEEFYQMSVERTAELKARLHAAEERYIEHMNSNGAEAGGRHETLIKTQFLSTTLTSATEAYFAALRSQEAAWVAYEKQKQNPVLLIIDQPLYPLEKEIPNPTLHMIFGFVAGFGLIFMLVIGRKFAKDYLKKQKEQRLMTQEHPEHEEIIP